MIEVSRATIIAAYELLRTCKPFLGWRLPEVGDVEFEVIRGQQGGRSDAFFADCDGETIRVARSTHGQLSTLLQSVAHEAIHLHQMRNGLETKGVKHNADFRKRSARVCRLHGWDLRTFV